MQKLTSFLLGLMVLLNAYTSLSGMCTEEQKNLAAAKIMINVYAYRLSQESLKTHIRSAHHTEHEYLKLRKKLQPENVRNAQADLEEANREAFRAYMNLVDCFTSGTQS